MIGSARGRPATMPNKWKKSPQPSAGAAASAASGLSRFVSGLRHEGGSSSLVVQTGFPTSLADLVVKNRERLKKPSRRKKRSSDLESSSGEAAADSPASGIGPSPEPRENRGCRRRHPVTAESSAPRGADCVLRPAAGPSKRTGFGFWLGLFLVDLFVLAVPAMRRRKLAAGITLAASGLWLLDAIGVRVFGFLRSCHSATRSLELASGGMGLERRASVSPIRELENEGLFSPERAVGNEKRSFTHSIVTSGRSKNSSDFTEVSDGSKISSNSIGTSELSKGCPDLLIESKQRVVDSVYLNKKNKVSLKRRDLGALAKVCVSRVVGSSSSNSKAKKLFRKFLPKKLRRKTHDNDAKTVPLDLGCGEISNSIIEHEGETVEGDETAENSIEDVISFISSDCVSTCDVENMDVVLESAPGAKCISSQHLACFAFILLGLLGGKSLALVITVFCFLFGKSMESLWKKRMDSVV